MQIQPARLPGYLALLGMALALGCAHTGIPSQPGASEEGLASFYAMSLAGRRTASGEAYDPKALTAAHRELPFGTIVRVERLSGSGQIPMAAVQVRINDRGPFVRGRIIDLSDAAARRLGMKRDGVVPVRLRVVSLP